MSRLPLLVLLCGGVSAGSHSLRYFYTGVTPVPGFPEFTAVGYVDEEPIDYYDSALRRKVPRQRWMAESQGPEYWERGTQLRRSWEQTFKNGVQILRDRTNQTGGIQTYQLVYGCELRDDGSTAGFHQHGWEGEDFISFDMERMVWVTPVPWGVITKLKWDQDTGLGQQKKAYLQQTCIEWLKKYVAAGASQLKPDPPKVSFTRSVSGGRLSCVATGFYPQSIDVTLLRDGRVLPDTRSRGILPNHDGTYQLTRAADVDPTDSAKFSCRVDHHGLPEPLDVFLVQKSDSGPVVIIAVVLVIAGIVGGVVCWKKRASFTAGNSGYNRTKTSDKGESSSNSSVTA